MGAIISYPDYIQWATLSGGNWSTALPLNNLKDPLVGLKARTNDAVTASGVINVQLDAFLPVRTLAVIGHNIGSFRFRAYSDSGRTVNIYDSGTQIVYPPYDPSYDTMAYYTYEDVNRILRMVSGMETSHNDYDINNSGGVSLSDATDLLNILAARGASFQRQVPSNIICAPSTVKAMYWKVDLTAGFGETYMELGRLWMGPATIEPAISISYGASLRFESRDEKTESLGGVDYFEKRTARRIMSVDWSALSEADKYKLLMMQYNLGLTGELLWVMNSGATARQMMFESFLAKINQSSAISYPYYDKYQLPLELKEIV